MTTHIEFTSEIIETLNDERYHPPVPLVQRRMETLWLKSHDLPHALIADLASVSENTIREYFRHCSTATDDCAEIVRISTFHSQESRKPTGIRWACYSVEMEVNMFG